MATPPRSCAATAMFRSPWSLVDRGDRVEAEVGRAASTSTCTGTAPRRSGSSYRPRSVASSTSRRVVAPDDREVLDVEVELGGGFPRLAAVERDAQAAALGRADPAGDEHEARPVARGADGLHRLALEAPARLPPVAVVERAEQDRAAGAVPRVAAGTGRPRSTARRRASRRRSGGPCRRSARRARRAGRRRRGRPAAPHRSASPAASPVGTGLIVRRSRSIIRRRTASTSSARWTTTRVATRTVL